MSVEVVNLRDEIWNIMHAVAEMGAERRFQYECGGDEDDELEGAETTQAAEKLVKMGDSLTSEYAKKKELDDLVKDITDYILSKSKNYDDKLEAELENLKPSFSLVGTTALKFIYGKFKEEVGKFLFSKSDEELGQIALVSSVTKGIAKGLQETSPNGVALATALGFNYLTENYEQYLSRQGGLMRAAAGNQA